MNILSEPLVNYVILFSFIKKKILNCEKINRDLQFI